MRCFIAIDLPANIKSELARVQEQITYTGKIKFVKEDSLHLTLKFLGEISEEQVEEVKKLLSKVPFNSFSTKLEEIGLFPNNNRPRIICVGLKPETEIKSLFSKIEDALSTLGISEPREFAAHITIGRIKSLKNSNQLLKSVRDITPENIEFKIDKFSFKESALTPEGSLYKNLAEFAAVK